MKRIMSKEYQRGFTMPEVVAAVAILMVLLSIAIPAAAGLKKNLDMTEIDDSARVIYIAAQNRLTSLKVSGKLTDLNTLMKDTYIDCSLDRLGSSYYQDKENIYCVDNSNTDVMGFMIPVGSVAEATLQGNYIIEFNSLTGDVCGVFYWKDGTQINGSDVTYCAIDGALGTGRDDKNVRMEYMIGYYGGGQGTEVPGGGETTTVYLTYYANNTTNSTISYAYNRGETVTLRDYNFSSLYTGHSFLGWSLSADDSKPDYVTGDTITLNRDVYLYAVWVPNQYRVAFHSNDNDLEQKASGSMKDETFTYHVEQALAANAYTVPSYRFLGWATSEERADAGTVDYTDGQTVLNLTSESCTVTLYAVWSKQYTVTYHANGGTGSIISNAYNMGDTATVLTCREAGFSRENHDFLCWNTKSDGTGHSYAAGSKLKVSGDLTLYAQWGCRTKVGALIYQYYMYFTTSGSQNTVYTAKGLILQPTSGVTDRELEGSGIPYYTGFGRAYTFYYGIMFENGQNIADYTIYYSTNGGANYTKTSVFPGKPISTLKSTVSGYDYYYFTIDSSTKDAPVTNIKIIGRDGRGCIVNFINDLRDSKARDAYNGTYGTSGKVTQVTVTNGCAPYLTRAKASYFHADPTSVFSVSKIDNGCSFSAIQITDGSGNTSILKQDKDYTVSSNGNEFTFTQSFLQSLTNGIYTVSFDFSSTILDPSLTLTVYPEDVIGYRYLSTRVTKNFGNERVQLSEFFFSKVNQFQTTDYESVLPYLYGYPREMKIFDTFQYVLDMNNGSSNCEPIWEDAVYIADKDTKTKYCAGFQYNFGQNDASKGLDDWTSINNNHGFTEIILDMGAGNAIPAKEFPYIGYYTSPDTSLYPTRNPKTMEVWGCNDADGLQYGDWEGSWRHLLTGTISDNKNTNSNESLVLFNAYDYFYSVLYRANGGSGAPVDNKDYYEGEKAAVSSTVPNRTGYTFLGWNTKADGSGISYKPGDTITLSEETTDNQNTLTLYAQWTTGYTADVRVELNGILTDASAISKPGVVTLTQNGKTAFTMTSAVTGVYQSYIPYGTNQKYDVCIDGKAVGSIAIADASNSVVISYYTVTFRSDGATVGTDVVLSGHAAAAPTVTKDGYTLTGWTLEGSSSLDNITGTTTAAAEWVRCEFGVDYTLTPALTATFEYNYNIYNGGSFKVMLSHVLDEDIVVTLHAYSGYTFTDAMTIHAGSTTGTIDIQKYNWIGKYTLSFTYQGITYTATEIVQNFTIYDSGTFESAVTKTVGTYSYWTSVWNKNFKSHNVRVTLDQPVAQDTYVALYYEYDKNKWPKSDLVYGTIYAGSTYTDLTFKLKNDQQPYNMVLTFIYEDILYTKYVGNTGTYDITSTVFGIPAGTLELTLRDYGDDLSGAAAAVSGLDVTCSGRTIDLGKPNISSNVLTFTSADLTANNRRYTMSFTYHGCTYTVSGLTVDGIESGTFTAAHSP